MTRHSMAFARFEAQARERDLSPWQCRAGREFLGMDLDELADMSGLDAYEVEDFENLDERVGLTVCERFKIVCAFQSAGVTFFRSGASEGVQVDRPGPGVQLWNDGPSPSGLGAALALIGWDTTALADLARIALARAEAIVSGDPASDAEAALLIKTFRAAGVRFCRSQAGESVRVKCRRPWYRAWLENRALARAKWSART